VASKSFYEEGRSGLDMRGGGIPVGIIPIGGGRIPKHTINK
jgi:hypothetical protein